MAELDFKLSFDFSTSISKEEKPPVLDKQEQESFEQAMAHYKRGAPVFDTNNLQLMDELDILRKKHTKSSTREIVSYVVGRVKIIYDGENYQAELHNTMHGDGFCYWKELYREQISFGKSLCWAKHVMKYGYYGQIAPKNAIEELSIDEHEQYNLEAKMEVMSKLEDEFEENRSKVKPKPIKIVEKEDESESESDGDEDALDKEVIEIKDTEIFPQE